MKTTKVYFSRRDAFLLAIFAMMLVFALWFTVDGVYALSWIFAAAGLGIYLVLRRVEPMLIQEDEKPIEGATPAAADPLEGKSNEVWGWRVFTSSAGRGRNAATRRSG